MDDCFKEIILLISQFDKPELQIITLENILAITGTSDGLQLLYKQEKLLELVLFLLRSKNCLLKKISSQIFVNISADEAGSVLLLNLKTEQCLLLEIILNEILDADSGIADSCCMMLSNISRSSPSTEKVVDLIENSNVTFDQIINVVTKIKYNNKRQNLHYLGPVLSNISQSIKIRKYILDRNRCIIQKLLPFTEYKDSIIKRGGIIGTLRNCCFETDCHSWLLSEDVDILPRLLLPLIGADAYSDEENEKLPLDLQYLPEDKQREVDPDIRCMLLEAITQLCALRVNREIIRNKNAYIILRDLHKWEQDKQVLLACENLVDILIRTEEEIGEDNIKDIDVPNELIDKFQEMNRNLLE